MDGYHRTDDDKPNEEERKMKRIDVYCHSQRKNYHSYFIVPKELEHLPECHLRAFAIGTSVLWDSVSTKGHYLKFDDVRISEVDE